jgi:hypothetical protein
MKTNIRIISIGFLALSTSFFACKKEPLIKPISNAQNASAVEPRPGGSTMNPNQDEEASAIKPKPVTNNYDLTNTTWRVNHYTYVGADQTKTFEGHSFRFLSNSLAVGLKGGIEMQKGKWSSEMQTKNNLNILFGESFPYSGMNGNWRILKQSDVMMFLEKDVKGGVVQASMERIVYVKPIFDK